MPYQYVPAGCVALEVLALPFQKASTNLLDSQVVLAGIVDLLGRTERNAGIDNLVLVGDKVNPFLVLGHGNGAVAKLANEAKGIFSLALQDAGIGIVCLLNLADNNGL